MKRLITLGLPLILLGTLGLGCAQQGTDNSAEGAPTSYPVRSTPYYPNYYPTTTNPSSVYPTAPIGTTNTGSSAQDQTQFISQFGGASTTFVPNSSEFDIYQGDEPLNNPDRYQISINMMEDPQHKNEFYGKMSISYYDNGTFWHSKQETGQDIVPTSGGLQYNHYSGYRDYVYNNWISNQGQDAFRAYFQDGWGPIILVLDSVTGQDSGDGTGILKLKGNGKIYYKMFPKYPAEISDEVYCWFITLGPYQCSAGYTVGGAELFPSSGYRLLGTFSGLDINKAFNK